MIEIVTIAFKHPLSFFGQTHNEKRRGFKGEEIHEPLIKRININEQIVEQDVADRQE